MITVHVKKHEEPHSSGHFFAATNTQPPNRLTQEELNLFLTAGWKEGDCVTWHTNHDPKADNLNLIFKVERDADQVFYPNTYNHRASPYFLVSLSNCHEYAQKNSNLDNLPKPFARWDTGTGYRVCSEDEVKRLVLDNDFIQNYLQKWLPRLRTEYSL